MRKNHNGERYLGVWIPEDLYYTFMAKAKRTRSTINGIVIRFMELYTNYKRQEEKRDEAQAPPPDL